jgi:MFS family permease
LYCTINLAASIGYSLLIDISLDIGTVIWTPLNTELGISYENLTNSFAVNLAGLGVGCIGLIPLAIIYGRRTLYIVSALVQFGCAVWQAKMQTTGDLIGSNILSGIAGSVSESIVQMTISDLFFVHQRATMNAIYLAMVTIGTFLAPVAAGYCATAQGWRWIWWWNAICLGLSFLGFLFFFEETKYTPRVLSLRVSSIEGTGVQFSKDKEISVDSDNSPDKSLDSGKPHFKTEKEHGSSQFPRRGLRDRFAVVTLTPGGSPSYLTILWNFVYLLRFPAVSYTALMYGTSLAWFSIILNTLSIYFAAPPYNFSPSGIGLLNLAPFIGGILSLVISAYNDKVILILAKRNGGKYEPEMRLWMALPGAVIAPAGMLLYGLSLAKVSC